MFIRLQSDIWRWAILFLLALILVFVWSSFVMLDRKIDKALERQGEINQSVYDTNEKQSQSIRVLETDSAIILRLLLSKEYLEGEEE